MQNLYLKQNVIDIKLKEFIQGEKLLLQQVYKANRLLKFIKLTFFRKNQLFLMQKVDFFVEKINRSNT